LLGAGAGSNWLCWWLGTRQNKPMIISLTGDKRLT